MTTSKEKKKDANAEMRELIKVGQTIFGLDIQILLHEIFLALHRRNIFKFDDNNIFSVFVK